MGGRLRHPRTQIATAVSGVLRALSICASVSLCNIPAALAQAVAPALTADIPAQPLAEALAAFARQTGLHLVYVSRVVRNQNSHAVSAGLSADQALARLLQGTGLRFELLTPHSVRILAAAPAPPENRTWISAGAEPYEIIISANRREENSQDVPITIQTMTGDQLNQLGVTTFNDLLKYTPNVTYSGNGPGTGNIFMRGLGSVGTGNQSQSTTAAFPNVALYLDEQAMQFPARNIDVYFVDMERIEILEGPRARSSAVARRRVRFATSRTSRSSTPSPRNSTRAGASPLPAATRTACSTVCSMYR